jgi:low temperature requirement protein LtrA
LPRLEHFGERHGLFVIIALGETLIVVASGVTAALGTNQLLAVAILAVAVTCSLWWSYFPRIKLLRRSETARMRLHYDRCTHR